MNKKWSIIDIIILIIEILAPTISILIAFFYSNDRMTEDVKLAIISVGIVIPVILLQISVTVGQKKSEYDARVLELRMTEMQDKLNHVSPILEQVFKSGNTRIQRFVYRRMDEVNRTIQSALSNNNSGNLRPSEYYEELLYLADLIIKDKEKHKKKFTGEVWAMTSFAEDEWIADEGYERLWTRKLEEIVDRGIKTRRLCIVPDDVYAIISDTTFSEPTNNKAFDGFIKLLDSYYGKSTRKKFVEHYFIRPGDNPDLTEIKGFFAIKLTNGELHILHGETVNENGAITAKVLFDPAEIRDVRRLFELYTSDNYDIGRVITATAKRNGFVEYLRNRNIEF